ncbi:MAG: hypothetical protein AB7O28_23655 [Vicinamibacterales bacterium]
MRRSIVAVLIGVVCAAGPVEARDAATVAWTAVGAAAGFGVGLLGGLRAFDDAVHSDRKVWTTAVIGGAVGAVVGFSIGHERQRRRAHPSMSGDRVGRRSALEAALLRELARGVRLPGPAPMAVPAGRPPESAPLVPASVNGALRD